MSARTNLAPLLQRFFTQCLMQQRQASPHTISSYRDTFRQLRKFIQQRRHNVRAVAVVPPMPGPGVVDPRGWAAQPEVVDDSAILVDPLDTTTIAEAMKRVAQDADLRRALRDNGLERVQHFDWNRCARQPLSMLENTVATPV